MFSRSQLGKRCNCIYLPCLIPLTVHVRVLTCWWRKGKCHRFALRPCSEDAAIDFLYLNKIINSVPLNLAAFCLSHPVQRCCSQAEKKCLTAGIAFETGEGRSSAPSAVLQPPTLRLSLGTAEHRVPLEGDKRGR